MRVGLIPSDGPDEGFLGNGTTNNWIGQTTFNSVSIRFSYRGDILDAEPIPGIGSTVMFALDMDNGFFFHGVNGVWSQNKQPPNDYLALLPATWQSITYHFAVSQSNPPSATMVWNFGQIPFAYQSPSGFSRGFGPLAV